MKDEKDVFRAVCEVSSVKENIPLDVVWRFSSKERLGNLGAGVMVKFNDELADNVAAMGRHIFAVDLVIGAN